MSFLIYRCAPLLLILLLLGSAAYTKDLRRAQEIPQSAMLLPGDPSVVAGIAGIDAGTIDPASAAELIFRSIISAEPPRNSISGRNEIRHNLRLYVAQNAQFMRFLESEHIVPLSGIRNGITLHLLFSGSEEDVGKTRKVLSFFGIPHRYRTGSTERPAAIENARIPNTVKNKLLFDMLQFRIPDRDTHELDLQLKQGSLPLMPDEATWMKILSVEKPELLFESFLGKPEAMRLYLALAGCSQSARQSLTRLAEPSELLRYSEALRLFGSDLTFENGNLVFPGSPDAWKFLSGSDRNSIEALFSDSGVPLLLYSSVSSAPVAVQKYLTGSAERLHSYYVQLKRYGSGGFMDSVAVSAGQDLPRIFRLLNTDPRGLVLDLGPASHPLLHRMAPDLVSSEGTGAVTITPRLLAKLLPTPGLSPYSQSSRADTLEFFRHLYHQQPEALSSESIGELIKIPEEAPVFLDLIGDLRPDADLLTRYLDYSSETASMGPEGWNTNRTRTSQSVFFLLSALRREGVLSIENGNRLLEQALDAFQTADEASFSLNTAAFLSERLIPALAGSGQYRDPQGPKDPILATLSGKSSPARINYAGRDLFLDFRAGRLRRMQKTLQLQPHTPLPVLLDVYTMLRRLQTDPGRAADEDLRQLSEKLSGITTALSTPGDADKDAGTRVARVPIDMLKRQIEAAGSWNNLTGTAASPVTQIAAGIHPELGVTLLTYCYAYEAHTELNVLTFDPNFVRKHRFYRPSRLRKPTWYPSRFVQEEPAGGFIEGSVAGLGFEFARLQIAQSGDDLGISSNIDIAPAMLSGFRQVQPQLRTDRSQKYVALTTDLGSRLASLSGADPLLQQWRKTVLSQVVSPQRLEQLGDQGARILSRSELFLLGQAYLGSSRPKPESKNQDTLDALAGKIQEVVPKTDSPEYNVFQDEVNQYGVFLGSRTGLSRFSFDMIESYEQLQKNLRPQYLYDRLCDLRIRIAELSYSLGLPASLGEAVAGAALPHVLPPSSRAEANYWKYAIDHINRLTDKTLLGWIGRNLLEDSVNTELEDSQTGL